MTRGMNPSTPALSEAARYLAIPTGIVSTGFGKVRTITGRLGIRFDRWQEGMCFVKFLWAVSAFLLVRLSGCF